MATKKAVRTSASTISGIDYPIPEVLDDKRQLNEFAQTNSGKKIVCVQGLGFVGAVMSLVVANSPAAQYAVIGVELPNESSYWKVCSINTGTFPIASSDPSVEQLYQSTQRRKNFYATCDTHAYSLADIVVIDVNLDVQKKHGKQKRLNDFEVDLTGFKRALESIASVCKEDVLLIVETTVPPGTCEKVAKPLFDKAFERRGLSKRYQLGYSYERVMPGPHYVNSIRNFYRVYAGIDEQSAKATEVFLRTIIRTDEYPLTRLHSTTACEISKVLENSFRAMNIAFIQEWTEFAHRAHVNLFEIVEAIRMRPTHKNIMLPGLGVGGYCLTKDPLLASWSSQNFFLGTALAQSEAAVTINDQMPLFSYNEFSKALNGKLSRKKVLLLGVSYLRNIGDTRQTPVELLYTMLKKGGCTVTLHDPYVAYWQEQQCSVHTRFEEVCKGSYDVVVFCTAHSHYTESVVLRDWLSSAQPMLLFDSNAVLNEDAIKIYGRRHRILVIGRGDIHS